MVVVVSVGGESTLAAQAAAAKSHRLSELEVDPQVRAVLDLYPGSRLVDVRQSSDNPA
jgi:DNA polymerase-3 subunit gamma/tau